MCEITIENEKTWLRCEAGNRNIDITNGLIAFHELKRRGKLPPAPDPDADHLDVQIELLVYLAWEGTGHSVTKEELRDSLPGIGGDELNESLMALLEKQRIAQGTCGCCYAPVAAGTFLDKVENRTV